MLINPNYVNDEDIMNTSFETTKLLFEQNKKDDEYMLRWFNAMKKESPSIFEKFINPKRIQQFLIQECNAEEIQSCRQIAEKCINKFKPNISTRTIQIVKNNKNTSPLLLSPTQILIEILKYAVPTKKHSNISVIPYQNLEFVCRTFWQIVRNNLYHDSFIELIADQPTQIKAVLQQWKYKKAKHIIIKFGLSNRIVKFRQSWQCLKALSIDIGQIPGINHLISIEDLTINSHIDCDINYLKLIGLDQYFDTRKIQKLQINGSLFMDQHIHEILNYDYNDLLTLEINDWNSNNCTNSILCDIPLEFKLSKMKTPNLIHITFTTNEANQLQHIDEYLHGDIWMTKVNKICTTAFKNNNNGNENKKLYLKYHWDTFCKSIHKNIKTNNKFIIVNDYTEVYIKPPPELKYKTTLFRDSDLIHIGSRTCEVYTIYNEVYWRIKIQNINNCNWNFSR